MDSVKKPFRRKITALLEQWMNSGKKECIVVSGARQIGKTYVIEEFLKNNFESYTTLNFDLFREHRELFGDNLDVDLLISKIKSVNRGFTVIPGKTALFMDEIQMCPRARTALKSFALDGRIKVVASGSLLGLSMNNGLENPHQEEEPSSNPVGYSRTIDMLSMDFEEFLWALGVDTDLIGYIRTCIHEKTPIDRFILKKFEEYFRTYMVVGGMPEAVEDYLRNMDPLESRTSQRKIVEGYRNDIMKYAPETEKRRITGCMDSIPYQLAEDNKKFMYSRIDTRESTPSARTYEYSLQWLVDAGIARKCHRIYQPRMPLELNGDPHTFKMYMDDNGLMMSVMRADISECVLSGDVRVNKGAIMENVIAGCLTRCGHELFYLQDKSLEIDFITLMRRTVTAIEVKSGNNTKAKSLDSVKKKFDVKRRMKFEDTNIEVTDDGVEHYPLFAAAFLDSMYDSTPKKIPEPGVDELNGYFRNVVSTKRE